MAALLGVDAGTASSRGRLVGGPDSFEGAFRFEPTSASDSPEDDDEEEEEEEEEEDDDDDEEEELDEPSLSLPLSLSLPDSESESDSELESEEDDESLSFSLFSSLPLLLLLESESESEPGLEMDFPFSLSPASLLTSLSFTAFSTLSSLSLDLTVSEGEGETCFATSSSSSESLSEDEEEDDDDDDDELSESSLLSLLSFVVIPCPVLLSVGALLVLLLVAKGRSPFSIALLTRSTSAVEVTASALKLEEEAFLERCLAASGACDKRYDCTKALVAVMHGRNQHIFPCMQSSINLAHHLWQKYPPLLVVSSPFYPSFLLSVRQWRNESWGGSGLTWKNQPNETIGQN
jgi:hypothetical protein